MVEISRSELEQLKKDSFALRCLENGGVDNWDWYSESLKPYHKKYSLKEDIERNVNNFTTIILSNAKCEINDLKDRSQDYITFDDEDAKMDLVDALHDFIIECIEEYGDNSD